MSPAEKRLLVRAALIGLPLAFGAAGFVAGRLSMLDDYRRCHAAMRVLSEGASIDKLVRSTRMITGKDPVPDD